MLLKQKGLYLLETVCLRCVMAFRDITSGTVTDEESS